MVIELALLSDEQLKREAEEREKAEQVRLQKKQEKELRRREVNQQRQTSKEQKSETESEKEQWFNKSLNKSDAKQPKEKSMSVFINTVKNY